MTTTKTALVVSATLVFAGIAGIAYQATALENVQRAQAAADSAIRQSDARVRALAQERADVERAAKALEQEVNRARADAQRRAEAAAMASATQPWDPIREGARFMGRHPEVRKAMTEVSRAVSRRRYAGLLSQLNLPPDRANAVVDRLAQDLKVFIPIGPEGQAAAFGMADEVDGSKFVSDMRDLLGDEGARKWQQYDRGATARDAAGRLAAAVSFSGSPLTNEQCAAVVNAVATHSANEQSIDWDAVNREVAPVLSPAQAAAFARVRDAIENDRKQMVVVPEKSIGDTASNSLPGR